MRPKTEQRETARRLRGEGRTYDEIQAALGVSKSSISLWVRDVPVPPESSSKRRDRQERMRGLSEAYWGPRREQQNEQRMAVRRAAAAEIGAVSDRELFLLGVGLYWAEGAKAKPEHRVIFVNSDSDVITLFEAWLDLLGVAKEKRRYAVGIHETADIPAAERFWAEVVGVDATTFNSPSVKTHNPKTNRKNVGEAHRGCLRITVLGSAELHRKIEGWWRGIADAQHGADSGRV